MFAIQVKNNSRKYNSWMWLGYLSNNNLLRNLLRF